MAAKKSPALDFTRRYLREKPDASFAEIRDAAAAEDMKIYPIVFGRAKALEGLVKVAPYGSRKKEREEKIREKAAAADGSSASVTPKSAPTSGPRSERTTAETSVEAVISGMRENHAEREKFRAALIKISEILDDVL